MADRASCDALALRVRNARCNGKGFLHGGVINALADNAMGLSIIETLRQQGIERGRGGSTVSLSLDFLLTAQVCYEAALIEDIDVAMRSGNQLLVRGIYIVTQKFRDDGRRDGAELVLIDRGDEPPVCLTQAQYEVLNATQVFERR
jgi:acyl-coenzyme A thioesterase PaaI-like protein